MKIRPARTEDLATIVDLCAEHAAYEGAVYDLHGKDTALSRALSSEPPRLYIWVADREGELVGYVTASPEYSTWDAAEYLHMDCLYLREVARGYGVGRDLMSAVAMLAIDLGFARVEWQTPEWNERAITFYERLGAVGRNKVRFSLDWERLKQKWQ